MPEGITGRRRLWRRLWIVSGLSALAVTAPVLDLYGSNPEVFVANRTSPSQILLFALLATLTVPLLALVVLSIAEAIGPRTADITYVVLLILLSAAVGLVVSRQLVPDHSLGAIAAAAAVGVAVLFLHRLVPGVFVLSALALPVLLGMFLATSNTSRLIWEEPTTVEVENGQIGNPAPIVFLQLDEFPVASLMEQDGTINQKLFPHFARLAEEGTWYRNTLSDSIATTQSVPAILTGKRVEKGMSPTAIDHPNNLFTLLGDDYEMHVIEWVTDLCPDDICPDYAGRAPARFTSLLLDVFVIYGHLSLPGDARESLPSIDNSWKGFLDQDATPAGSRVPIEGLPVPGADVRSEWIDWVQRIVNGMILDAPPTLHFAHLNSPHVPWQVNPSGTHYTTPEGPTEVEGVEGDGHWTMDPDPPLLGFQRHLLQLGFLDTMLGRLLDKLDETGAWDEAMVIVVADHGASFVPGEHRRWPQENNRDDLYRVPLFIKYPNQTTGETIDDPVFGIDILPTIVDALDIDTTWEFDGISLFDVPGTERTHQPIRWCCNGDGASTDVSVLFDQVERNHQWIPDQGSWLGIAAVGPYPSLVGEPVTSLEIQSSPDLRWSLGAEATTQDEDGDGMVQTLVTGRVELPGEATVDDVLFVVDDRVAGVGYVSRDSPSGGSIRGILAEALIEDGPDDDFEVLVRSDDGESWLSGTSDDLVLQLYAADGRLLEIRTEGSRRLQVSSVTENGSGWTVEGWAADISRKLTPDQLYVFAGDALLVHGPPNVDNGNVVNWFDSEDLLRSGFVFEIDESDVPASVDQLTVVAEFDEVAIADPARISR